MGLDVGGHHDRPDWPKMGPSLLIATCLIVAIRTAKWPPRADAALSGQDLADEIEFAQHIARRVMMQLMSKFETIFPQRKEPSDLDLLFVLPWSVYTRIEQLQGNKQSQLLREVKGNLAWTFPKTDLKADGQIVDVPFTTYQLEVIPVFRMNDGSFLTPHTANGGSWRFSNPAAEYQFLHNVDLAWNMKATRLTQMLKAWKYQCNVPIKSFSLEVLATVFVQQWQHRDQSIFYYDWMIRDFFEFMLRYVNGWTRVVGTEAKIQLGDAWESRCRTAQAHAIKACEHEQKDWAFSATAEWQAIFGNAFEGTSLAKAIGLA